MTSSGIRIDAAVREEKIELCTSPGFCPMVAQHDDILEIINSMKGFLAAFRLQSITRDQVLGLFKPRSDSFCSMISRSEDMTVNISPMNGVLAAFGLQATSSLVCSGQAVLVR